MHSTHTTSADHLCRLACRLCVAVTLIPVFVSAALGQPAWRAIDLGAERSGLSVALDINNAGHVVGWRATGVAERGFIWTAATGMVELGGLDGHARLSHAIAINDAGQVVGDSFTDSGRIHAFLWTASTGMRDLGTLGGEFSAAYDINGFGHVVGTSTTASGETHAFLWTAERGMVDLGTLAGFASRAYAINDIGEVVGDHHGSAHSADEVGAFLWQGGTMHDLGTLGGAFPFSSASGINNAGHVVGNSNDVAWWWMPHTGMIPIGTPLGSFVNDVNDSHQTVGVTGGGRAFTFSDLEGMNDLGTLGGRFSEANSINQAGQIVGSADTSTGERHAALWCGASVPIITGVGATPSVLSSANGDLVTVRVDYTAATRCGGSVDATLSVTSSEPDDGPADIEILDGRTVRLRAERLELGPGRTYTIRIRAVDGAHESAADVSVMVPIGDADGGRPMTGVTLTTDVVSPQPMGSPVVLSAVGAGGTSPFAYRFWIQSWDDGVWRVLQDWSAASTFTWTGGAAGGYNLAVEARRASSPNTEAAAAVGFVVSH